IQAPKGIAAGLWSTVALQSIWPRRRPTAGYQSNERPTSRPTGGGSRSIGKQVRNCRAMRAERSNTSTVLRRGGEASLTSVDWNTAVGQAFNADQGGVRQINAQQR